MNPSASPSREAGSLGGYNHISGIEVSDTQRRRAQASKHPWLDSGNTVS